MKKTQLFSSRRISHTVVVRVAVFLLFFSSCKTSLVETEKLKGRVWRVMSHCEGALLDALMFPGLSQFSHSEKTNKQTDIKVHRFKISHLILAFISGSSEDQIKLWLKWLQFLSCMKHKSRYSSECPSSFILYNENEWLSLRMDILLNNYFCVPPTKN